MRHPREVRCIMDHMVWFFPIDFFRRVSGGRTSPLTPLHPHDLLLRTIFVSFFNVFFLSLSSGVLLAEAQHRPGREDHVVVGLRLPGTVESKTLFYAFRLFELLL